MGWNVLSITFDCKFILSMISWYATEYWSAGEFAKMPILLLSLLPGGFWFLSDIKLENFWKFNDGTTRKSLPADSIKQLIYISHLNKKYVFFIMIDLQKLQRALEHFIECVTLLALVISQLCSRCFYGIFFWNTQKSIFAIIKACTVKIRVANLLKKCEWQILAAT